MSWGCRAAATARHSLSTCGRTIPSLKSTISSPILAKNCREVYEFLVKLEGFLGKPILRLNPDRDFDFWLKQYNNFLPSPQTRWCTRQLKLRPFEQWNQTGAGERNTGV